MRGVVLFMLFEISGLVTNNMSFLCENPTDALFASICPNNAVLIWVCNFQNWCSHEQFFQPLKAFLTLRILFKIDSLLLQGCNRMCNPWESFYKSFVVSCQSHEWPYLCHILRSRPLLYGFYFAGIDWYPFFWDDVSQILNLPLIKGTFAQLFIKFILP